MASQPEKTLWDFRLFGPVRILGTGRQIVHFRTRETAVLMARLAMANGRPVSREVLAGQLWPDADSAPARHSLSQALYALRCDLEHGDIARNDVIRATRDDILFNSDRIRIDVVEFEKCASQGSSSDEESESLRYLQKAIEIYDGEFLAGHYDNWTMSNRHRLESTFVQTLDRATELSLQSSPEDAISYIRQLIEIEPWRESSRRQLVTILLETGNDVAARREAKRLETWLAEESIAADHSTLEVIATAQRESSDGRSTNIPDPAAQSRWIERNDALTTMTTAVLYMEDVNSKGAADLSETFRQSILEHGGYCESQTTAAVIAIFERATDAIDAAISTMRSGDLRKSRDDADSDHAQDDASTDLGRMAIHTAERDVDKNEWKKLTLAIAAAAPNSHILCSAATANLAEPWLDPSFRLIDVGEYIFDKASQHLRLYSVSPMHDVRAAKLLVKAPRVGAIARPKPASPMFGRESEREAITRSLKDKARLVTVTGPGGIGKSRLALEVINDLFDSVSGRIWIIDTDDLEDVQSVIDETLRTIEVSPSGNQAPRAVLIEWLRHQAGGLVIFDGFERVVEHGGAEFVGSLLEKAPYLRCLITSRRRLNSAEESWHVLGPLPTPDPTTAMSSERLLQFSAPSLFVERAQAASPGFAVNDDNAQDIARICYRLEGHPLAIILAAAQVNIFDSGELQKRLADSLNLLRSRRPDLPKRQRTLEDAVAWSIDLLPEDTQTALLGLTVFLGGFDLDAACAISDDPLTVDHIACLEESSIVSANRSSNGMRFYIPEVIRAQVSKIVTIPRKDFELRHAEYFADWVAKTCGIASISPDANVMRLLDSERENIRVALDWLVESEDVDTALRLAAYAWRQWASRGWYRYGYDLITKLLDTTGTSDHLHRAKAAHGAGTLAYRLGRYDAAVNHYSVARDDFMIAGDQAGLAYTRNNLAMFAQLAGDLETAAQEYSAALEIKAELGDRSGVARGYLNLANIAFEQGNLDAALSNINACIAVQETLRDDTGLAASHGLLGAIAEDRGDSDSARNAYTAGVEYARAANAPYAEVQNLQKLASWTHDYGKPTDAEKLYLKALSISEQTDNTVGVAYAQFGLAAVLAYLGQLNEARGLAIQALDTLNDLGYEAGIVRALLVLGHIQLSDRAANAARDTLRNGLEILESGSDERRLIETLEAFSGLAHLTDKPLIAAKIDRACRDERQRITFPRSPKVKTMIERWGKVAQVEDRSTLLHQSSLLSIPEATKLALEI